MRFRYKGLSSPVRQHLNGHAHSWIAAVAILAFCLGASAGVAVPVAKVESGPVHLGGTRLCQFDDDSMTLIVNDQGRELTRHYFCSSYGKAAARVIQDARGEDFVLLTYGEGRGTNATTEYLAVFRLAKDLVEYVRTPVSAGAGPLSRWHYTPRVQIPAGGGLRLVLTLSIEGEGATWLPSERTRVIELNTKRR